MGDISRPWNKKKKEVNRPYAGKVKPSISANLVVISPYLTNPPPIATIAAMSAAIPAS